MREKVPKKRYAVLVKLVFFVVSSNTFLLIVRAFLCILHALQLVVISLLLCVETNRS